MVDVSTRKLWHKLAVRATDTVGVAVGRGATKPTTIGTPRECSDALDAAAPKDPAHLSFRRGTWFAQIDGTWWPLGQCFVSPTKPFEYRIRDAEDGITQLADGQWETLEFDVETDWRVQWAAELPRGEKRRYIVCKSPRGLVVETDIEPNGNGIIAMLESEYEDSLDNATSEDDGETYDVVTEGGIAVVFPAGRYEFDSPEVATALEAG